LCKGLALAVAQHAWSLRKRAHKRKSPMQVCMPGTFQYSFSFCNGQTNCRPPPFKKKDIEFVADCLLISLTSGGNSNKVKILFLDFDLFFMAILSFKTTTIKLILLIGTH
jgi:hypothetical protein